MPQIASPPAESNDTAGKTLWELALEGAGQGVWDHNLVMGTAYYSPAWYEMRGFKAGDDIDRELGPWSDRLHPDDREQILQTARRQNSGELSFNAFEYRERARGDRWIWILSRGRPVAWNDDGSVARIVGTDTDITQLKLIEQQLAEEKERLHVTLQSIADGMISTGPEGLVTFINAAAENLTGWKLAEAVGKPFEAVLNVRYEDRPADSGVRLRDCIERSKIISLDDNAVVVTRSGAKLAVRLTASPVLSQNSVVLGAVVVFQDVTQSRDSNRRLAYSATHDALTGLPNRVGFSQAIEMAAKTARLNGRRHALCYIDLDHFKAVNDGAGHGAGDAVLIRIANLIRTACRVSDFAGRIGGDEFILLLSDCTLENAKTVCQKIVEQIASEVFSFNGVTYQVGASIGVTSISHRQPSAVELTAEADAACYAAKSRGRGCVVVHLTDHHNSPPAEI